MGKKRRVKMIQMMGSCSLLFVRMAAAIAHRNVIRTKMSVIAWVRLDFMCPN